MTYQFRTVLKAKHWTIGLDKEQSYGYFENDNNGSGGGLWFEKEGGKLSLIDYDGMACLPKSVAQALRAVGYDCEE